MSKYLGKSNIQEGIVEEFLEESVRRTGAGCDVHRDSIHVHHVRFTKANEVIRLYCKFSNTHSGIDKCCQWITRLKEEFGCELFVIESTGNYHKPLVRRLREIVPCCVVNPSEFRKYGKKADKFDAKKLAQFSLQDVFSETYVSSPTHEEITSLSRAVRKVTSQIVANSNSIGSFLTANDVLMTHSQKEIRKRTARLKRPSKSPKRRLSCHFFRSIPTGPLRSFRRDLIGSRNIITLTDYTAESGGRFLRIVMMAIMSVRNSLRIYSL